MKVFFKPLVSILVFSTVLSFASTTDQGSKSKSFNVSRGGTLEVSILSGSANLEVNVWEKNEVNLNVRGFNENEFENIVFEQSGNVITITDGGWSSDDDAKFIISVPSKFNLNLKTNSGDVKLKGALEGDVTALSYGGEIHTGKITGKVNLNTSGGDIVTGDVIGNAIVKSAGGNLSLNSVSRDADIFTYGGDIKIGVVGNYVNAKTNGGDITIEKIGGSAELFTFGGDLYVKDIAGNAKLNTYGGDITLTGANGLIIAKTGGGNIKLQKLTGSVNASTGGGDISVQLQPGGTGKSRITSGSGDIKLMVPENSRAEIDAVIKDADLWNNDDETGLVIKSDFKTQSYEKDSRRGEIRAKYILNGGGEKIYLQTINSTIEIKKLYNKKLSTGQL
ncbi:MAG: DUF4097 family beta strand repeat-containing protein [Ignavibacteriales bacterium]|nr:DUF4097 family beta strand repeat-containing protein [Ignavibacteriales bacterium]